MCDVSALTPDHPALDALNPEEILKKGFKPPQKAEQTCLHSCLTHPTLDAHDQVEGRAARGVRDLERCTAPQQQLGGVVPACT